MKYSPFTRPLAVILTVVIIAPSVLLSVPQQVRAQEVVIDPALIAKTVAEWARSHGMQALNLAKNTLTSISTYTSAAANQALVFNAYVLQPLAFIMSGNLLKALTASVVKFVVGAANGTGLPQFVQNLPGHLQRSGDVQALAFFVQFGRNINSPFSQAISSSLRTNYLQNTSMAGFWAANRSTLPQFSTDINAYLAGDWSKGGTAAWFALTTQQQNNPYLLYQNSQAQLASLVMNTTEAKLAELSWGQGFLSWCGSADEGGTQPSFSEDAAGNVNLDNGGTAPGDPCKNADGTTGTIKTPGSTIKAMLDKALGANQDKLVQLGQLANQVGGILGNIATVMSTVNFAQQLLGGLDSGGLAGAASASGSRPSFLSVYQSAPGYMGVTPQTVQQTAAQLPSSSVDVASRINNYDAAWGTIRGAAAGAKAALHDLATTCIAAADAEAAHPQSKNEAAEQSFIAAARSTAVSAATRITEIVEPIFVRADQAAATVASARALLAKVQAEASTATDTNAYLADVARLQTMPPTQLDASQAQQDAQALGVGSLVDQLNAAQSSAISQKISCVFIPPLEISSGGD